MTDFVRGLEGADNVRDAHAETRGKARLCVAHGKLNQQRLTLHRMGDCLSLARFSAHQVS
jgi:hypothetical protein